MIKRIRFEPVPPAPAPAEVAPVRAVVCTALPDLVPDPVHAALTIEWFVDAGHLDRFAAWSGAQAAGPVVVAEEHVLRGAEWLEGRWARGGCQLKHMALAQRAAGLSPAEFSERWRSRAGKVGTAPIPEPARGLAYVQNHATSGTYDAVNEVYFDDVDGLRRRIQWFAENLGEGAEDDLVARHWFLAVREDVIA